MGAVQTAGVSEGRSCTGARAAKRDVRVLARGRSSSQATSRSIHIDRSGRRHMLEVHLVQATGACAPQAKDPHPLGQGAFDRRSALSVLLALVTGIPTNGVSL